MPSRNSDSDISKTWQQLLSNEEVSILMVGLQNAGKTTLLSKLQLGHIQKRSPATGFAIKCISYQNINLTSWDVGGKDKTRLLSIFQ